MSYKPHRYDPKEPMQRCPGCNGGALVKWQLCAKCRAKLPPDLHYRLKSACLDVHRVSFLGVDGPKRKTEFTAHRDELVNQSVNYLAAKETTP